MDGKNEEEVKIRDPVPQPLQSVRPCERLLQGFWFMPDLFQKYCLPRRNSRHQKVELVKNYGYDWKFFNIDTQRKR